MNKLKLDVRFVDGNSHVRALALNWYHWISLGFCWTYSSRIHLDFLGLAQIDLYLND